MWQFSCGGLNNYPDPNIYTNEHILRISWRKAFFPNYMFTIPQAATGSIAGIEMRDMGCYVDTPQIKVLRKSSAESHPLTFCWSPHFPSHLGTALLWGAVAALGWDPWYWLHFGSTGRDVEQVPLPPLALGKCCTSPLSQLGFKLIPPHHPKEQPMAALGTWMQPTFPQMKIFNISWLSGLCS